MSLLRTFLHRHTCIIDRYLFQQFLGPFVLAVAGFAIIGLVDILMYLVELAVISGISFVTVIQLLIYKLPAIMILFFPMAVLFSVMIMLIRMAKDNELTVLRSSGVHTFRIVIPVTLLLFLTTGVSYLTNEKMVPWTNRASDNLINQEIKKKPPPIIKENVLFKDADNRFYYIKKVNNKEGTMKDVLIFERSLTFPRIISAKEAEWSDSKWTLRNGTIQEINENGLIDFSDKFTKLILHVDQGSQSFYKRQKTAKEMDSKELKEKITVLKRGGVSTLALKVEYHMKKSMPTACLIFGFVGIAFCLTFVRTGKDWWGVITSICIAVLAVGFYFFIVAVFRAIAKDGNLIPFLGAWIPNILYGSIASIIILYQSIYK
ncbi:MAG: lipopolysaccharide export system permease protein [Candidatus Marinamargulisbacteria bacterium]|jgi:lipopolysaccharide export system permease protein